jgi:hypothetical protein
LEYSSVNVDKRAAAKDKFPFFGISLVLVVLVVPLKIKPYRHKGELYLSI